jgi:hypothetical protein
MPMERRYADGPAARRHFSGLAVESEFAQDHAAIARNTGSDGLHSAGSDSGWAERRCVHSGPFLFL